MKTKTINKKDCVFSILGHPRLGGATGMWKTIKMTYGNESYFMFHSAIAFRRKDQVPSFSASRRLSKCEAQRVIDAIPNTIEIYA